ncbi:MAG: membrane protein insertase YidC [Alphaproteobacteria bacterium]|nr:membrane protein insertase YidC [Alphaproteobacteria bacterium]
MSDQKNLIVAVGLSILILVGFNYFYERPKSLELLKQAEIAATQAPLTAGIQQAEPVKEILSRQKALTKTERVSIDALKVRGSINLKGGVLDDLVLVNYHEKPDPASPEIVLLSPLNTKEPYYVRFGWVGQASDQLNGQASDLPGDDTQWKISEKTPLQTGKPIKLQWQNSDGLKFERSFEIDDNYLFTVTDRVINTGKTDVSLVPYSEVVRVGTPVTSGYYILHEGALGVLNGRLNEFDYPKLQKTGMVKQETTGGWVGFTDKYWLVALIPDQKQPVHISFANKPAGQSYHCGLTVDSQVVKPGQSLEFKQYVFAGAKVLQILDQYEEKMGFDHFDLAVDFGWFYFVTKPLFYVLDFLRQILGNMGLAIIVLTVFVKLLFYPLANKSFKSMARMKALQPHIERIKEKHGDDKMRVNQEMMELYKREKINPVAGCLPMLIQAPIFFCLYKVFFVTIEMRHAPFYLWIHDLSAPDPTSFFNLFGLLPFDPPSFLMIGVLPLLMGVTMLLQQKMNPQPTDPVQAKMMMLMPVFFTYLFASFPAGLVIYWAWSNILTIAQQYVITRMVPKVVPKPSPLAIAKKTSNTHKKKK